MSIGDESSVPGSPTASHPSNIPLTDLNQPSSSMKPIDSLTSLTSSEDTSVSKSTSQSIIVNINSTANLIENDDLIVSATTDTTKPSVSSNAAESQLKASETKKMKKKGTSNLETLMHMIKANIGTGVLAMPLAFKNGGLVLSSIGLWIMAAICIHCMHILLECYRYCMAMRARASSYDPSSTTSIVKLGQEADAEANSNKSSSESIGYEDVVYLISKEKCAHNSKWPRYFKIIVSIFLVIGQFGFCCVYLVFVPKNIQQVIDYYHPHSPLTLEYLMCIVLLPLAVFCLIKNLKILAPFSTLANGLMISSMLVILYELFFNGKLKPMNELELVASYTTWPIYFSSAIYAFEGISLVLPVYHEMRNKSEFTPWNGVLNTAMMLVAVMYFSIGFFGYLKYGNDSEASITLNLPNDSVVFQIVKILFAIAIFISYNLQFYVGADITWSAVYRSSSYLQTIKTSRAKLYGLYENLFRIGLVVMTFVLAINVPRIDLFISLVGAIASSTLAVIIPPVLDHIVFYNAPTELNASSCRRGGLLANKKVRLVKNVLIILFGVYIFLSGTVVSIRDIVNYLRNK